MKYTVVIERASDGSFSAYVPDLPGCVSCGDTQDEVLDSMEEAVRGHIETLRENDEPIPEPRSTAAVINAA